MSINSINPINNVVATDSMLANEIDSQSELSRSTKNPLVDSETKQLLDKATGLLQTIVSDRLTEKVIRKIPDDEYLELLSLLDEMVSGTVDKRV